MQNNWKIFFSEFSAALIFTIAYFVIAGRASSDSFSYSYLQIALFSAMLYVFVIFIASYSYKVDIFPAFSLMRCFIQKTLDPLLINIPAQLIGAALGFLIYLQLQKTVLSLSPVLDNSIFYAFEIKDVILRSFVFTLLVYILSYLMVLIRYSFRLERLTGTLLISVVVFMVSAVTLPLESVSIITLWQDILLSFYHYRSHIGDLLEQSLKQILIATPLLAIGAALAYFKLSDLMEDNIITSTEEEMEISIDEQFDSNFDI
ncbi:MAG: hypothetical protein WD048_00365 [Chitinophagales bacterium]